MTVLERSYARLTEEARLAGKEALFDHLRAYILEPASPTDYRRLGADLGIRANTIAVTVHRLRTRLRELVREELAETIESEADLLAELRELRSALEVRCSEAMENAMPDLSAHDFGNTRWSLVVALRQDTAADADVARQRLIELCLHYWFPVYAYVRRSGHSPEMAQRMTARFFTDSCKPVRAGPRMPRPVASACSCRTNCFDTCRRTRRRQRVPTLEPPLSVEELEARRRSEPPGTSTPEWSFRHGFALEIIATARARLRDEAREAGHLAMFEVLEHYLGQEPQPGDYDGDARRLGARPVFVALAVKRLRQRFANWSRSN